jgi:long-chain acyl-CoA synthetase
MARWGSRTGPGLDRAASRTAGAGTKIPKMFYRRFLESVERWPDAPAVEIQRQPGSTAQRFPLSTLTTTPDGHTIESFTYRQLRRISDAVGRWLTSGAGAGGRGPQQARIRLDGVNGRRCAILAANSPAWVAAYLGIIASGNIAVPFDTAFNPAQVAKLLQDSGATLLFVDQRHLEIAKQALADEVLSNRASESSPQLVLLDAAQDGLPCLPEIVMASQAEFTPAPVQPDDVSAIIYTSGTTSDPKGVMLTDGNLTAELESIRKFVPLSPRDALLGVLPLFHVLAQMANLFIPLGNGARVLFLDSLNTQELTLALRERGITIFCCVPQFFYLIHERIFGEVAKKGRVALTVFRALCAVSSALQKAGLNSVGMKFGKLVFGKVHAQLGPNIRYFVTGGSRFDAQIGLDIQALGFTLLQAYGLTETTSGCLCTPPFDNVVGSIGRPLHGVKARLVDPKPDESGRLVGEIAISGPTVMKGYHNRPEATAEVLRDGWLYTGDLAYCDAKGDYFITGRAKDVIVLSSGKNVYPEEIESYYLRSPWIKELCVLGLETRKPGEPLSERLHGVIVPNFEVLRNRGVANVREVIRYDVESISATLPATKRILSYDIWQEDLPRTTTRKIRRREVESKLKAMHTSGQAEEITAGERRLSDDDRAWLAAPDVQTAVVIIAEAAGKGQRKEIHPNDNLELDLGLDSMERVELLTALAHRLGATVEDSAASQVYTVRELVDLVRQKAATEEGRPAEQAAQAQGWSTVLEAETTDPDALALTRRHPVLNVLWWIFNQAGKWGARLLFRLRIEGLEHLPQPPYILCPNHASYLDAPVLTSALPWRAFRQVFFVGTTEIFGAGLMRRFATLLHLIPVDPDASLVPAMRAGAYGLRTGKILVLYPEGERSIEGPPKQFKKGAAILAHHLNIPIVPVAQYGFYEVWPRGKGFQGFHPLRIRIGKPISPDPNERPEQAHERLTTELRNQVVEMWDELAKKDQSPRVSS